jgi:hypothetical protein
MPEGLWGRIEGRVWACRVRRCCMEPTPSAGAAVRGASAERPGVPAARPGRVALHADRGPQLLHERVQPW